MKLATIATVLALGIARLTIAASLGERASSVEGFDVSNYQPNVDFSAAYKAGARFVIIKVEPPDFPFLSTSANINEQQATEGTSFIDAYFSSHYIGATNAKLIRGGYHFARPDVSSGSSQATFFLAHGGGWTPDGRTLPGMIDLESENGIPKCYGKNPANMVAWIQDFVNTYHSKTGRYPMIYTNRDWWTTCTGDSDAFSSTCPLVLASWNSVPGPIPGGWPYQTIWQYNDHSPWGGDSDSFNGDLTRLTKLATG